ncbi:MAG: AraC family transcriptional regulator [Pseudomonadales bacterium]
MSKNPNMYLDNPDALSSVLSKLQLNAQVYSDGDFCGAWAVDTSGSRRIPFHLIGRGEAWLHMDDRPTQMLSSGDLVIFPGDKQHVIASSSEKPPQGLINSEVPINQKPMTNLVCGFFEFKNKSAWPLLDSLAAVIVIDLSDMNISSVIRGLIDLMVAELDRRAPGFYTVINHLAYLLFVEVLRLQIQQGKVDSGLLAALFDSKISRALSAMHSYPGRRWTLESLAAEAAMGRSSFAHQFNELTGIPPMQYLTSWRMQEAKTLLQTTTLSLAHIAEQCGYESEVAFRKAFKKTVGTPPGAVRRRKIQI